MGKTHRKSQPQGRARTTRSSKPRLVLSDPGETSTQLTNQLRALGLYPASTLGDGNCLFRALSDQLYGSPSKHAQLRQDICDYIVKHKSRYEPFVEDERGLDVHIRCMKENGTYGGHMELSAFAHMVKRDVKVVQPGLVYVIEWGAGLDDEEREKAMRQLGAEEDDGTMTRGTVYVAYHDWEHFSSIRNLRGPHSGLPNVQETPGPDAQVEATPADRAKEAKRDREKERREKEKARKVTRVKLKLSAPSPASDSPAPEAQLPDSQPSVNSTQLSLTNPPLSPAMRIHRSPKRSFDESSLSTSSEDGHSVDDVERSAGRDKRSRPSKLAESTGDLGDDTDSIEKEREETPGLSAPGSSSSSSSAGDEEFNALQVSQSLAAATGLDDGYSSLSELESSPEPELAPVQQTISAPLPATSNKPLSKRADHKQQHISRMPAHHQTASAARPGAEKPLTRRQRKALGLPKARAALVFGRDNNSPGAGRVTGAGKIVIPGGRFKGRGAVKVREFREGEDEDDGTGLDVEAAVDANGEVEEWVRTGVGRVDVRGFRELKI